MIESNWQDSLFTQSAPELGNQYRDDPLLGSWLRRTLPAESLRELEPELDELGAVAGGPLYRLQIADRLNEPTLRQWDAWGNRVDELEVTSLWREAERLAVRHGLVATGYEPAHGRHARIAQFAKVYLFHPSSDVYTLPARDDGRRGPHAAGRRKPAPRGTRAAAAHGAGPGARVDQRAMDDRDDRRLGRRALTDTCRRRRRRVAALRSQVVHVGRRLADGADARASRGQPGRRQGPRDVLRRDPRRGRAPERPHGRPPEGQARHAQGADGRADARGHAGGTRVAAGERHARDRADADGDPHVEQRLRRRQHAARTRARALVRVAAHRVRAAAREPAAARRHAGSAARPRRGARS